MNKPLLTLAGLVAVLGAASALAQQPPKLEPLPDIPPPPRMAPADPATLKPQVTVRQDGSARIEEFRIRGKLYAVRVTPAIGKPYWLVDKVGAGNMTRMDDITGGVNPPQWVLFEF